MGVEAWCCACIHACVDCCVVLGSTIQSCYRRRFFSFRPLFSLLFPFPPPQSCCPKVRLQLLCPKEYQLQFGMIYSSTNLSIAGLFAFAAFSPNNVDAIGCKSYTQGSFLSGYSSCEANVAVMNKFDGISGLRCVSERVLQMHRGVRASSLWTK